MENDVHQQPSSHTKTIQTEPLTKNHNNRTKYHTKKHSLYFIGYIFFYSYIKFYINLSTDCTVRYRSTSATKLLHFVRSPKTVTSSKANIHINNDYKNNVHLITSTFHHQQKSITLTIIPSLGSTTYIDYKIIPTFGRAVHHNALTTKIPSQRIEFNTTNRV